MLPKINSISKKVHLPICGKDVRVYAYSLGEEKNLVVEEDEKEIESKIIDLISKKVPDIDVATLTVTDIIVLFLTLVDISKGLKRTMKYRCSNKVKNPDGEDAKCGMEITKEVDLSKYEISGENKNGTVLPVTNDIKIELVYPSYLKIKSIEDKSEANYALKVCSLCIKAVYYKEDVYTEFTEQEIFDWVMSFPPNFAEKFEEFLSSMPTISVKYDVECPKCHAKISENITNIIDFFMQGTLE